MRKKVLALGLAVLTAAAAVGCGNSEVSYMKDFKGADYVELCDYIGIPVEASAPSVSDTLVDSYVSYTLASAASYQPVTDHDVAEEGDTVNIDYVGKLNGEAFDGGTASGYDLTLGSGSFIDGFEDGLIGVKVGDTVDLNLTFPEDYSNTDLAGQDVVFTVTVNSIEEYVTPELTDEYVQSLGRDDVQTVEDYRKVIYDYLYAQAESSYNQTVQNAILEYLKTNSTFKKDPPEAMVSRYTNEMTTYYYQAAQNYGMDITSFLNTFVLDSDNQIPVEEDADDASVSEDTSVSDDDASDDSVSEEASGSESLGALVESSSSEASESEAVSGEDSTEASDEVVEDPAYLVKIRELATDNAKGYVVLKAVADKEGLMVKGKEYKNALSTEAANEGYTSVDDYKANEDAEAYRDDLTAAAVLKFLQENAVITEPVEEDADTSDAGASSDEAASEDAESTSEEAAE